MFSIFTDSNKLLQEAIKENSLPKVEEAIKNGADINKYSNISVPSPQETRTPDSLILAIDYERPEIFQYLLNANAKIRGARGTDLLLRAIEKNNYTIVYELIKRNVSVNRVCRGSTPLIKAIEVVCNKNSNDETVYAIIQLLLDMHANPNLGYPLIMAVIYGNYQIVKMLINAGAEINKPCIEKANWVALHYAASNLTEPSILTFLLSINSILVDFPDEKGETPLMIAAKLGNLYAIEALIKAGADSKKTNKQNKTVGMLAKDSNTKNFISLCVKEKNILGVATKEFIKFEKAKDRLLTKKYNSEIEKQEAFNQYSQSTLSSIIYGIRDLRDNVNKIYVSQKDCSNLLIEIANLIKVLPKDDPKSSKILDHTGKIMELTTTMVSSATKDTMEAYKDTEIFNQGKIEEEKSNIVSMASAPASFYYTKKKTSTLNESWKSEDGKKFYPRN